MMCSKCGGKDGSFLAPKFIMGGLTYKLVNVHICDHCYDYNSRRWKKAAVRVIYGIFIRNGGLNK